MKQKKYFIGLRKKAKRQREKMYSLNLLRAVVSVCVRAPDMMTNDDLVCVTFFLFRVFVKHFWVAWWFPSCFLGLRWNGEGKWKFTEVVFHVKISVGGKNCNKSSLKGSFLPSSSPPFIICLQNDKRGERKWRWWIFTTQTNRNDASFLSQLSQHR